MGPHTSICMEHAAPAGTTTPPENTKSMTNKSSIDLIDPHVWYGPNGKTSSLEERINPTQCRSVRIPKVPTTLRYILNYPKWIKPYVISIGPYHYGDKCLQEGQKLKYLRAEKFMDDTQQQRDELYRRIENKIDDLAKCYDSNHVMKYNKKQLATMFLLDGCFLLHFIYYSSKEDGFKVLNLTNHEMAYIKQDLFLLENQLPYQVLKLLFKDAKFKAEFPRELEESPIKEELKGSFMEEMIKDFVTSHIPLPRGILGIEMIDQPCHLLHLLQCAIVGQLKINGRREKEHEDEEKKQHERKCLLKGGSKLLRQLLALLGVYCAPLNTEDKGRRKFILQSNKNVHQLKAVGIHFRPSETSYLTDVSFTSHCFGITGCLRLPPITIDISTMIIFLNLIAFESSNAIDHFGVISYLCFLDSLIDHWDDVKELQAARILHNFLGDQREVAKFFNHVCGKLVPNYDAYKDVILQIQEHVERHHSSKSRKWLIQCKNTYFNSPWSIIALIGAFLGLSLTAVQTYTSVASS
ncbi:hypothetical protein PVL29_010750 [Vitis rotundifolia]|uniref:Uncharacterized protein n=1 Tax=Vitis rotundifolia TaxID=103349 RepID=A0AA38ZV05_VITRO|nr:hypothetical protein PVL29_010750 [Vitis rotundifolia]